MNVAVKHLRENNQVDSFMSRKDKFLMACFYRCKVKPSKKSSEPKVIYCDTQDSAESCITYGNGFVFHLYGYILDAILGTNCHIEGQYRAILDRFTESKPTLVELYDKAISMSESGLEQLTDENNCESTGEEEDKTPTEQETGKWSYNYQCSLSFQDMDTEAMVTNAPPPFYSVHVTCGGTSPFRMPEVVTTRANSSSMSVVSGAPSTVSYQNTMTHNTITCETASDVVMERLSNIPNASVTQVNGSKMLQELEKDTKCTTNVVIQHLTPIAPPSSSSRTQHHHNTSESTGIPMVTEVLY